MNSFMVFSISFFIWLFNVDGRKFITSDYKRTTTKNQFTFDDTTDKNQSPMYDEYGELFNGTILLNGSLWFLWNGSLWNISMWNETWWDPEKKKQTTPKPVEEKETEADWSSTSMDEILITFCVIFVLFVIALACYFCYKKSKQPGLLRDTLDFLEEKFRGKIKRPRKRSRSTDEDNEDGKSRRRGRGRGRGGMEEGEMDMMMEMPPDMKMGEEEIEEGAMDSSRPPEGTVADSRTTGKKTVVKYLSMVPTKKDNSRKATSQSESKAKSKPKLEKSKVTTEKSKAKSEKKTVVKYVSTVPTKTKDPSEKSKAKSKKPDANYYAVPNTKIVTNRNLKTESKTKTKAKYKDL